MPNDKDIVNSKGKQCGLEETTVIFKRLILRIIKPDQEILARQKLLRLFYEVTVVIFLADLSGYDKTVDEHIFKDKRSTHLRKTLMQFEDVCNSSWLAKAGIILVLHRLEAFREKIAINPLRKYFPDYTGGADYASALAYISNRLTSLNRFPDQVVIHHSMLQEDDSSLIALVVKVVNNRTLESNLKSIA